MVQSRVDPRHFCQGSNNSVSVIVMLQIGNSVKVVTHILLCTEDNMSTVFISDPRTCLEKDPIPLNVLHRL